MRIRFQLFLCLLVCGFISAGMAQNSAASSTQIKPPPYAFDAGHISAVREQVKRVRWTDQTITQSISSNYFNPIRTETVKAALLGGKDRVSQAFMDVNTALSTSPEAHRAHEWFQTLQTYDCLWALPETVTFEFPAKNEAQELLKSYANTLYQIVPDQDNPIEIAIHQAACIYAGLLTSDHEKVQLYLHGNEDTKPFWKVLSEASPSEGIVYRDLPGDIGYLIVLLSALKEYGTDEYDSLKPWIYRHIDFIIKWSKLMARNGNAFPVFSDDTSKYWGFSALERSARIFEDKDAEMILQTVYKNSLRRADMLIFGKVQLDSLEEPQLSLPPAEVFPRIGAGILTDEGDVPLLAYLSTGINIHNHPHYLNLFLFPPSTHKRIKDIEVNNVLVDRQHSFFPQANAPQNALITSFKPFQNGGTYLSTSASGKYGERANYPPDYPGLTHPVTHYQRDVYVYSPYIIDWFRVSGGSVQDYIYYLPGENVDSFKLNWQSHTVSPDEYQSLQQADSVKKAESKDITPIASGRERLWLINDMPSSLLHAQNQQTNLLINRREFAEPTANLFTVVHEIGNGNQQADIQIESLPLTPQTNATGFQANAIVIKNTGRHDIFFSTIQPDQIYQTKFHNHELEFQAKFAHIQLIDGQFKRMRIIGGTNVRFGKHAIHIESAVTPGILHNLDEKNGTFSLQLHHAAPVGDLLKGHIVQVVNPNPEGQFMQPLALSHVENTGQQQQFLMRHRVNLSNPPQRLAAPVQNGDQVIYESFAELNRQNIDRYLITHASPLEISVPAGENANRFFMEKHKGRALGGTKIQDTLHVSISMNDSYDGTIEVIRVP